MSQYGEVGSGVTRELLVADTEAKVDVLKSSYHLTAIYDWHFTLDQASDAVEQVVDNSIVFVEGHMRDPNYANMRLSQHIALADARFSNGVYGAALWNDCEALAAEFLQRQYSTPTEHDLHSYALYRGLLAKGCVLLPADYLNLDEDTPQLAELDDLRESLHALFPIGSEQDLEKAVELDATLLTQALQDNVIRESEAFNFVLYFLNKYSGLPDLHSMAKAPDGKVQAYIIYGLAHRDSLTAHFERRGIPIEQIFVNPSDTPIDELRNLAAEMDQSPDERRKMIRNHYLGIMATQPEA